MLRLGEAQSSLLSPQVSARPRPLGPSWPRLRRRAGGCGDAGLGFGGRRLRARRAKGPRPASRTPRAGRGSVACARARGAAGPGDPAPRAHRLSARACAPEAGCGDPVRPAASGAPRHLVISGTSCLGAGRLPAAWPWAKVPSVSMRPEHCDNSSDSEEV